MDELEQKMAITKLCMVMQDIYQALNDGRGTFCCCGVTSFNLVDSCEITDEMWDVLEDAVSEKVYQMTKGNHVYTR